MGRDKALLPYRGGALAAHVAGEVLRAAGSVTLVGAPLRYAHLGFPVARDLAPGAGPLGGICSALRGSQAEWNLLLACDMPRVTAAFLEELLAAAEHSGADCLLPAGPSGLPEPLCAVYHQRCLGPLLAAFARGERSIAQALQGVRVHILRVPDGGVFDNCNTPEAWTVHADKTPGTAV